MNLINSYSQHNVHLTKIGQYFFGLCPFHKDSKTSFVVYEDGSYHCFGCQAHGTYKDFLDRVGDAGEYIELGELNSIVERSLYDMISAQKAQESKLRRILFTKDYSVKSFVWKKFDDFWLEARVFLSDPEVELVRVLLAVRSHFNRLSEYAKNA